MGQRKIILSTNVAETSLTIHGRDGGDRLGPERGSCVAPATGLAAARTGADLASVGRAAGGPTPGGRRRAFAGGCGRKRRTGIAPRRRRPRRLRSDLAEPLLQLLVLGEYDELSVARSAADAEAGGERAAVAYDCSAPSTTTNRVTPLGKELSRLPAHPAVGSVAAGRSASWRAARDVDRGACSSRSAIRFASATKDGAARAIITRCERGPTWSIASRRCRRFTAGCGWTDPALELHHGGARNVLRSAEQLYRLVDVNSRRAERDARTSG